MAAHSGKGSANGSGANPALDADAADELAANFRPSWAADDDDDLPPGLGHAAPAIEPPPAPPGAPAPGALPAVSVSPVVTISDSPPATSPAEAAAPAAPQTQKMLSPQTVIGMGSPVRAPEPSSEALDSQNVIEVAPAKSLSTTQPMNTAQGRAPEATTAASSRAPVSASPASAKPVTTNVVRSAPAVDPFKPSALDSDEFPQIKKSNKGLIFGVVGVGIAVGLGLFLKFALSPDEPAKTSTTPAATTTAAKENDIPPPPPQEDTPPAATTATATPPPTVAKADPPPAATPAEQPKKADPPPTKAPDPPRTVAAAPAKPPKQPAASPPAAPPKTPPKSTGGGIVRDSPF